MIIEPPPDSTIVILTHILSGAYVSQRDNLVGSATACRLANTTSCCPGINGLLLISKCIPNKDEKAIVRHEAEKLIGLLNNCPFSLEGETGCSVPGADVTHATLS